MTKKDESFMFLVWIERYTMKIMQLGDSGCGRPLRNAE